MNRNIAAGAAGVLSLAVLPYTALAQAPAATNASEIVVTAQKRAQALADVPLPVQALSETALEDAGATKVSDLVSLIPGASIVSNSTPGFETVQIRGISSGTTGDGLVGYYIDETPFGIPNLQLTPPSRLLDVQQVEVIRGPSGTLYGQGSMGGTIKLVTRKPDATAFSGKVQGEYSNTSGGGDNNAIDAVVNIPLIKDQLAVRLSAGVETLSGYAEAPELNRSDVNGFEGRNYRVAARWTPSDDLSISALYWNIKNEQDYNNGLTPGTPIPTIAGTGGIRGYTDVDMDLYSLTVEWNTPIGALTSNSSYIDHTLDFVAPLLFVLNNDSTFDTTSFTQEIRLASTGDGPINWIGGVFYRDATIDSDVFFTFAGFPLIDVLAPLDTKSWSVFGEVSWKTMDGKLEALAGARYFEDDRSAVGRNRIAPIASSTTGATYDSFSPRFNLSYRPTDSGLVFFNAAKGFRSGVLQTPAQAAAAVSSGIPTGTQIAPDELWTYELGTRWELAGKSLLLEASVYHTDWKDIQLQFASAAVISLANAGDATIDGFDIGLVWRTPIDGLTLQTVANWNNAEFDSVVPALAAALPTIRVGKELPSVPDSNYTDRKSVV